MSNDILDIAIIGAGAAGTYAAYRLATDPTYDNSKIKLFDYLKFEGKPHIGGRLWSPHLPGLGYTRKAELGGMRYLTTQEIVTNILPVLNLENVPFDVDSKDNLYNLRDSIIRNDDISNSDNVPYKLSPMEQGMSPGALLIYAIESVVPNAPYLNSAEWLDVKKNFKVDGYHLYELGFWNLLERVLSEEGYQYVLDGQGYNTIPSNWNAADAMEWTLADFGANASYRYVHKGYQELPETLLKIATEAGVGFQEDSKLKKWLRGDDGILELLFESTVEGEPDFTVQAKKLIMAVPKRALELIDMPQDNDSWSFYNELLPAVQPQPMFKFFLGYKYPWWRVMGMTSGRTITSNPLRQIYYWGSNYQRFFKEAPDETGGVPNDPENSIMMIYLDGRDVPFWQPIFELLNINTKMLNVNDETHFDVLKVYTSDVNSFLSDLKEELGQELEEINNQPEAESEVALKERLAHSNVLQSKLEGIENSQAALDQVLITVSTLLRRAHSIQFIPDPYTFAYADWTADPFGGAYNLWKPGYKSWEVTKHMLKPFGETEVYVVGEAYSTKQGWVEGAFETAEQMLETYLGLEKPDWLPNSYNIE